MVKRCPDAPAASATKSCTVVERPAWLAAARAWSERWRAASAARFSRPLGPPLPHAARVAAVTTAAAAVTPAVNSRRTRRGYGLGRRRHMAGDNPGRRGSFCPMDDRLCLLTVHAHPDDES